MTSGAKMSLTRRTMFKVAGTLPLLGANLGFSALGPQPPTPPAAADEGRQNEPDAADDVQGRWNAAFAGRESRLFGTCADRTHAASRGRYGACSVRPWQRRSCGALDHDAVADGSERRAARADARHQFHR